MITESYLDDMRDALHRTSKDFDGEIKDLIESARQELILSGVLPEKANDESDPLIKRAVTLYLKADFGLEPEYSDRYRSAFESLKISLVLSKDYTEENCV